MLHPSLKANLVERLPASAVVYPSQDTILTGREAVQAGAWKTALCSIETYLLFRVYYKIKYMKYTRKRNSLRRNCAVRRI